MKSPAKTTMFRLRNGLPLRLIGIVRHDKLIPTLTLFVLIGLIGSSEAAEPSAKRGSGVAGAADVKTKPPTQVSFLNVVKGYRSGVREPLQTVVRSQAEWMMLWRRHSNDLNATPPAVVFDLEIVVAIFLGEKPTGGYDVTIQRAEQSGDELMIDYQEKTPAPGSINILVFQQPFHIVRINREVGPKVTFRRTP